MKGENNIGVPLELYEINLLLRSMKNCEQGIWKFMGLYLHPVEEYCKNLVIDFRV